MQREKIAHARRTSNSYEPVVSARGRWPPPLRPIRMCFRRRCEFTLVEIVSSPESIVGFRSPPRGRPSRPRGLAPWKSRYTGSNLFFFSVGRRPSARTRRTNEFHFPSCLDSRVAVPRAVVDSSGCPRGAGPRAPRVRWYFNSCFCANQQRRLAPPSFLATSRLLREKESSADNVPQRYIWSVNNAYC